MMFNVSSSVNASIDQELESCKLFQAIFYSVIFGTVCLLGLVGNAISFAVLRLDSSMPVASFQLRSLAVADSVFLILWMIHYSLRYLLQYIGLQSDSIGHSLWLCIRVYTFPMLYMAQTGTIWFTVALGLSRYLAVCTPYGARKFCSMVCIRRTTYTITALSVAYNLPRYFEIEVFRNENDYLYWRRTSLGFNVLYKLIYTDVLYCAVTFIVPLVTLSFMNTKVISSYREIRRRRSRIVSQSQAADNECSITLVMIIIVVVFIACHLPARIIQMLYSYRYSDCQQPMYYWTHASIVLEVLNSSVNFLIYWGCHKQFRRILPFSRCCSLKGKGSPGILPYNDPATQGDPKNGLPSKPSCMIILNGLQTHPTTDSSYETAEV